MRESLVASGQPLEPFALAVAGYYADPMSFSQQTTTRAAAALVQGNPADDLVAARYVPRLLTQTPLAAVLALSPAEQALLFDPAADFDGDGLPNDAELTAPPTASASPSAGDADGDGHPDDQDPCPMEAANSCLRVDYLVMDTDGDGYDDAIDNCMNDENAMQDDANEDGIGDACLRYANIARPVSNVRLFVGGTVHFSSIKTELWSGTPMAYLWDFDGAAPNSTDESPGDVVFGVIGDYTIAFTATDVGGSLPPDVRHIVVQGAGPLPTVDIGGPYFVLEGEPLALVANASSQNGAILSTDWTHGDGTFQSGNPASHVYAAQGTYALSVEITDAFLLTASDATAVTVVDSAPTAAFAVAKASGAPYSYQFSDDSTAYDGVVAWDWSFGDGSTSTLRDPSHPFPSTGTFPVSLTVTDGDGSIDTIVIPLVVPIATPTLGPTGVGLLAGLLALAGARLARRPRSAVP